MNKVLRINEELCPKNHPCPAVQICPVNALTQIDSFHAPSVDLNKCIRCGRCTQICKLHCLILEDQ